MSNYHPELCLQANSYVPITDLNDKYTYCVFRVQNGYWYYPEGKNRIRPREQLTSGIGISHGYIDSGIVSFETFREASRYATTICNVGEHMEVVKCIIPQGSKYLVGTFYPPWGEYTCYASEILLVGEPGTLWERLVRWCKS